MSEESEEFDEFDSIDPENVLRTMLAAAISIGAPVYNSGDHRGCFEIYAACARMLIRVVEGADDEKLILAEALKEAVLESDVHDQAWIMRRAFDQILGEEEAEEEFENLN